MESPESRAETKEAWKVIEKQLGSPSSRSRGKLRMYCNGKLAVRVAFSMYHDEAEHWWYGIDKDKVKSILKYESAYIVFLMDSAEQFVVVPAKRFERLNTNDVYLTESNGKFRFKKLSIDATDGLNNLKMIS